MRKLATAGLVLLAACSTGENKSGGGSWGLVAPTPSTSLDLIPEPEPGPSVTEPEPTTTTAEIVPVTEAPTPTTRYIPPRTTTTVYYSPSSDLASIRACESGGDYSANTGNGYYGAYQFSWSTWASVGGTGNPAHASPSEQDMRAQMMIDAGRRGEWPSC